MSWGKCSPSSLSCLARYTFQVCDLFRAFSIRIISRTLQSNIIVRAYSHVARFSVLMSHCREGEPVSPTQTILLKLLDSFLNPVPTPFRGRHDHLNKLTGFLASVFLFQVKHAQHVIQKATGEPPPGENIVTDVGGAASCALDGRLPGVWVALVLLSTSLSSILLAEQEDHSGAKTEPVVVTLTHFCHDTISTSRSRTGTGFIEELVGMMVPRSASYLLQRQSFVLP